LARAVIIPIERHDRASTVRTHHAVSLPDLLRIVSQRPAVPARGSALVSESRAPSGDDRPIRPPIRYRYAQASDRGLVREQNEDAVAIAEVAGLALVADGMGGYNAGEVASGLAAEFLREHLVADLSELQQRSAGLAASHVQRMLHALLRARIDGVNDAIIEAASRRPEFYGMGTTLAMLLFRDDGVMTVHLGDSRIYRMRDEVLSLLTRDHSLLQEQIDAGVLTPGEARDSINRNFVTRALGVDTVADPEINDYDLLPGDLYLICSDGLPDMLGDEEIFDLLRGWPDAPLHDADDGDPVDERVADAAFLQRVANRLVAAANARGGRDNVSVVLASAGFERSDETDGDGAAPNGALAEERPA
jgi:protein phosphatase